MLLAHSTVHSFNTEAALSDNFCYTTFHSFPGWKQTAGVVSQLAHQAQLLTSPVQPSAVSSPPTGFCKLHQKFNICYLRVLDMHVYWSTFYSFSFCFNSFGVLDIFKLWRQIEIPSTTITFTIASSKLTCVLYQTVQAGAAFKADFWRVRVCHGYCTVAVHLQQLLACFQTSKFPPSARGGKLRSFIGYYCAVKEANLTAELQLRARTCRATPYFEWASESWKN